jgi:hypothetical protein
MLIWTPASPGSLQQFVDIRSNEAFPDIRISCSGRTEGLDVERGGPPLLLVPEPAEIEQEDRGILTNTSIKSPHAGITQGRMLAKFGPPSWEIDQPSAKPVRLQRVDSRMRRSLTRVSDRFQQPEQHTSRSSSQTPTHGSLQERGLQQTQLSHHRRLSLSAVSPAVLDNNKDNHATARGKRNRASLSTDHEALWGSPRCLPFGPTAQSADCEGAHSSLGQQPAKRGAGTTHHTHVFSTPGRKQSVSPARPSTRRRSLAHNTASFAAASPVNISERSPARLPATQHGGYRGELPSGECGLFQSPSAKSSSSRHSRPPSVVSQTRSSSLRSSQVHLRSHVPRTIESTAALAIYHTECVPAPSPYFCLCCIHV